MNSLSLYLHIPFCTKKCRYCDFYSVDYDDSLAERYLLALSKEIDLYNKYLSDSAPTVRTIFIGGGTPSVLSSGQLSTLCALLRSTFSIAPDCEWTVECNPESFTGDKASVFLHAGVTRLTFGFQSLDDRQLPVLGRIHSSDLCRRILVDPLLKQFASIGVDLMYGLPGQTAETLMATLQQVAGSPYVKHISAYELTVADGTPFGRHRSMLPLPADETMASMTAQVWDFLATNGFEQYEVSNFAKPGHECRHNIAYWNHEPYLGLGCSAHSFLPPERSANVRDVNHYCEMTEENLFPREFTETIDANKLGMEMIFLGLRRVQGINEKEFQENCGMPFADYVNKKKLATFMGRGLLTYEKPFWKPTRQGLLMADGIARELL
ncbi:MAG: radical SAM family heme chaperone HemW [Chitinispirillaceae bacterium]|jgi:oxygen-independent coproporphyrinogen-3 oxidase